MIVIIKLRNTIICNELRLRQLKSLACRIFLVGFLLWEGYGLEHMYMWQGFVFKNPGGLVVTRQGARDTGRCLASEQVNE